MRPIEFYFDFSSPYAYLMAEQIDAVVARHGREVRWRPFLLGAVFQRTGDKPLPDHPLKGPYARRDFVRSGRFYGIPVGVPARFPISTHQAARVFYLLHDRDPAQAKTFARAVFRRYFTDGVDVSSLEEVLRLASTVGVGQVEALAEAAGSEAVKARLKRECDEAIARGVFGSPFVFVDEEPFWGVDRLPQIERWLAEGGF